MRSLFVIAAASMLFAAGCGDCEAEDDTAVEQDTTEVTTEDTTEETTETQSPVEDPEDTATEDTGTDDTGSSGTGE